jgi:nitroreductase
MNTPVSRAAEHPIDESFLNRWSPRAFTDETLPEATLLTFLEAARWAPSSYNMQPWRFVYARRGTEHWDRLLGTLNEFNRSWANRAAAIVIVLSKKTALFPGQAAEVANGTHSFDAGTAWGYLALQASLSGWQAHGMAGIDREKARLDLHVPDDFSVEVGIAIGRPGDKSILPEGLQAREVKSQRQPVASIAFEGLFKAP